MAKKKQGNLIAVIVVVVLGAAAFAAFQWNSHSREVAEDRATAAAYHLDGTPCQTLTAAEFAAIRKGRKGTPFQAENASFIMGYGASECRAFNTGVGQEIGVDFACHFNNPGWLQVKTQTTTAYFAAPASATIAVTDGAPRCVLKR